MHITSARAFAKQADGSVRIVASAAITAQMPGGQVNTMELAGNGNEFNRTQAELEAIRAKLERPPSAS